MSVLNDRFSFVRFNSSTKKGKRVNFTVFNITLFLLKSHKTLSVDVSRSPFDQRIPFFPGKCGHGVDRCDLFALLLSSRLLLGRWGGVVLVVGMVRLLSSQRGHEGVLFLVIFLMLFLFWVGLLSDSHEQRQTQGGFYRFFLFVIF